VKRVGVGVESEKEKEKDGGVLGVDLTVREKGAGVRPSLRANWAAGRSGMSTIAFAAVVVAVAVAGRRGSGLRCDRRHLTAAVAAVAAAAATAAAAGGRRTAYENLRSKEFLRRSRLSKSWRGGS
jgi:hypothetical protein